MNVITALDILEINNLVAKYFLSTDNADADGFMETWVSPNEFGGYESDAFGRMGTWQEMYEFEKKHVSPGGMANGNRHIAVNINITAVNSSQVFVTHDMLVIAVADSPRIVATGRYNNSVVVKTSNGWRFKRRSLIVDPGYLKVMQASSHNI